jgi:hypothetical protein
MKKKLNRKLRVERETIMVMAGLDHDEVEKVRGGVLCSRCDTTCASCRCNTVGTTCKSG